MQPLTKSEKQTLKYVLEFYLQYIGDTPKEDLSNDDKKDIKNAKSILSKNN